MMKRTISLLLSLAMVLSLMPANFHAFAEEIPTEEVVAETPVETTPEETLAIQETVPVEEAESYDAYGTILLSGRCGTNLSWYLYSNGELVISGWGPMDDYKYNTMPWNIADNRSNIKTITIEHGVTSIGNYAFAACPNLTSVTMPSTVTSIGNAAFSACSSLYVLDIGKNVATIGMSAFSNCTSLTQVTLGESLTSIGDYAFDSTRMMDLVFPETLTSIGSWVFLNCYSLKYLSFKGNAPSFGSGTFSHFYGQVFYHTNDSTWTENVRQNYGGEVEWIASDPLIISKGTCGRYAEWVLTEDGLLTISGTGAMNDYPLGYIPWNEHQRDIKNVAIEKGITGIGLYAFRNCSYLTSLVVPESVTNISASAFEYSSIREITFEGDAPTFGENAFKGKVITVHYPANNATWTEEVRQNYGGTITWVADEVTVAEGTCGDNLTWKLTETGTLTISGQGRMQLYDTATAPWHGYREWIQKVVIEDGVTSIGYGAFFYCTDMTSVEIPDSVTVIDPFAFQMCESLTEVQFPETLTTIGRAAFSMCKSLTSVTIPDSVTRVEEAAFIGCEALTDVTIGKGVSYLCGTAFMRCSGLTEFKISPENAHYCVSEDGVLFNKDMTYLVSYPAGKAGAYTVPGTVTEIGYCAFESCKSLTSVTIPASVEQIDESAFYNTGLKEVHFEGDAPELIATYVGDHYWFRHYAGLTLPVYYPADNATWTDEAKAAFNESTLKWVAYEEETYLAKGTCGENLEWTLTEDGVLTISGTGAMTDYATASESPWYDYRTSITKVVLGDGVTSVGDRAFYNCTALTDVTIGNKVATIGGYAFRGCTALVSVTIPASVTEIKGSAFRSCSALEEVTFLGNAPTMGTYVFTDCHENLTLNCYEGSTGFDVAPWTDWKVVVNHVGQWIVDKEATCTTDGSRHIDCAYCGTIITEIIVGSHNYVDGICSVCNEVKLIASGEFRNGGWKLDIFGTLTIYGTGVMDDKPWRSYAEDIVHVIIEDGITDITHHAFQGCTNLVDIIIPDSVTKIQYYAFEGCSSLREVDIPEGVPEIENDTFMNCTSLTRVSIPESVTIIDSSAFDGCSSLADVTIPESVETIELYAFRNCSSLAELVIPETVTSIGYAAFYGCTGLVNVTIPNSVTSLGDSVFHGCTSLTRVDIPDSVTSLGASAFRECSGLTQVTIGKGVTEIGAYTFSHCRNLAAIVIPEGVTSIGNSAFSFCSALTELTIGSGVTTIGSSAFSGCTGLTEITFEGNAPAMDGNWVFYEVKATAYYPAGNETWTEEVRQNYGGNINWKAYYPVIASGTCGDNLSWTLTEDGTLTISGTGDTYDYTIYQVEAPWYEYRSSVKTVIMEDGVTGIGTDVFNNHASLTSVTIPKSVTDIGDSAFINCDGLTEVRIPDSVLTIGDTAFFDCDGLTNVVIPDSVTGIGRDAFYHCNSMTSLVIGASVSSIGNGAFTYCHGLAEIVVDEANEAYLVDEHGVLLSGDHTTVVCCPGGKTGTYTVPASVTDICGYAFAGCSGLTEITFEGNAPSFGNYVFWGVTATANYPAGNETWTEAVRQNYGGNINWKAYYPVIASGICGPDLTWSLDAAKTLTISGTGGMYNYENEVTGPWGGSIKEVVIQEGVTSIGGRAFRGCRDLVKITIPETVVGVEEYAFENCSGIQEVHITNLDAWLNISFGLGYGFAGVLQYADAGAVYLNGEVITEVVMPEGLDSVGHCVFAGWSSLESVIIPESVTEIGRGAFVGCSNLANVNIPENVTYIDWYAFQNCGKLTEITLPQGIESIGMYTFAGCSSLQEVVIPESVVEIGTSAFWNCSSLTSVTIPKNVRTVEQYAFRDCSALKEINFTGDAPRFSMGTPFAGVTATAFYPGNNATWTEDVRQNYGGTITWVPYGGAEASIGDVRYETIEEALAAAKPGDVVTLTADAVAGNLFVPVGVTLDLAEYSLTADYLFGVKGTFLTGTPEKAKLMVPKDNVILAQDGYVNAKGQYVLPIWDPASNCFQFSLFVVNTDTSKNRGLKINEAAEEIRFQFKHQATSNLNSLLLADGASDNEMSIVIRLSWTNDQGTAHQDFVYNDNQVAKVTGSYDYTFVLTGYSALNINLDTLVVQAMVITNSGATAFGTAWTQQMLK